MYCEKCGKELQDNWKSCPDCGAEVKGHKRTATVKKEKGIILESPGPIDDGGRKFNIIYWIMAILGFITALACEMNFLGCVMCPIIGMGIGWLIKNKILDTNALLLRNRTYAVDYKIPYSELISRLIPILTPLGMTIEKSADHDGCPVISYQGIIYDIRYEDTADEFEVWWRKNLVKAVFTADSIDMYRKIAVATGIIAYYTQQVCQNPEGATETISPDMATLHIPVRAGEKKSLSLKSIIGVVVIIGVLAFAVSSSSERKYIDFVKEGCPTLYPDITYGEAFDSFFGHPSWSYFKSDDGKHVVEFTGDCTYADAEVTATVQFVLDMESETFELYYLDFNDIPQMEFMKLGLVTAAFDAYAE